MSKKVLDWDPGHVEYLTHMAHHVNGPTDFDDEVQHHLDRLYAENPKDSLGSPEDDQNLAESHQDQAIANVRDFGNAPVIPKLSKPSPPSPPSANDLD